jgi:hypothetical protein
MTHITRRKFLEGIAGTVGVAVLAPAVPMLPVPVTPVVDPYEEFAKLLVAPILQEIKGASIMRQAVMARERA